MAWYAPGAISLYEMRVIPSLQSRRGALKSRPIDTARACWMSRSLAPERALEKRSHGVRARLADALERRHSHDAVGSNTRIRDGQMKVGAVGQSKRRRAAYLELLAADPTLLEHRRACLRTRDIPFEPRHIECSLARDVEQYLGAPDILSLPEERATHAKIIVCADRETLVRRRPARVERGQRRRWPVVLGIWRERRCRLLDGGQPPLLLEQRPRRATGAQQLQREGPRS